MTSVCKLSRLSLAAYASLLEADEFHPDKIDPGAAGMSGERLARIGPRMKEFVDSGKSAGIVTLIARHGHVASLEAIGYQDLETKTGMKSDAIFRVMSVSKPVTAAGLMVLV